jgi:hypothetical protein
LNSKVFVRILVVATVLLVAAPVAHAGINMTGVLSNGSQKVTMDSVRFIGDSTYLITTPGWGGDTMVVDTFQFPAMYGPPTLIMLTGMLNGTPLVYPLAAPVSDSWYILYSMPTEAKVKFIWEMGGVDGRGQPGLGNAGLAASPSIVSVGTTIRAERVAGTNCVFEFYDAAGNKVRTLRAQVSSGVASVAWNGADELGRRLPEGIYYCCIGNAANPSVRKLILTR